MTIKAWMEREGLTNATAAVRLGTTPFSVAQLSRGVPVRTLRVAERYSLASGGLVSVEDVMYPKGIPAKVTFTAKDAEERAQG